MNNQRKEFEERMQSANLSEGEKSCYRRLNFELMRSRIVYTGEQLGSLAKRIKPMVKIDVNETKVIFCSEGKKIVRALIADAPFSDNYLTYLKKAKVKLEHLKYPLLSLKSFTCYFPTDDKENINLTVEAVLQQAPRVAALKQATCFEVCFLSDVAADNYDPILQCHKASVVLYAPDIKKIRLLRQEERELPTPPKKDNKQISHEQAQRPRRLIPLRQKS